MQRIAAVLAHVIWAPVFLQAAGSGDPSPVGKVFFAEVTGDDVFVHSGDRSQPVSTKETYLAEGLGIETEGDSSATMVFSNGLAVQLSAGSSIEVKRFSQEPFRPNRTDLAVEPSISVVAINFVRGTAVLATSKLAAGSLFTVFTPLASVTIQGGTLLLTADAEHTEVSMLSGTCVIYGRSESTRAAIVSPGQAGTVQRTRSSQGLDIAIDVVTMAAAQLATTQNNAWGVLRAKQTVYFEQKSVVAAFNDVAMLAVNGSTVGATVRPAFEVVPVQVAPQNLPVEYTVSPAALLPTVRR